MDGMVAIPVESLPLPPVFGLRHALSTRLGGVSEGAFSTLNLGLHVEDDPVAVAENRRRFARAAGYAAEALVTARQVHGTGLAWAGAADRSRGALDYAGALPDTDGLLTAEPGVPLAILVADCAPVLLADPVSRVLAVVHAGWRGALGRIASRAVCAMMEAGARPEHVLVGIGPALCPTCLEVGNEVGTAVEREFGSHVLDQIAGTPHLRLHEMLVADLAAVGVAVDRIFRHTACTRCRTDRFYSHRGQQGRAGRFALVAWWNEP